ncbi:hypothetical protein BGZ65_009859 [Modicella reniformis]|uniref:U three protein 23 n=1 Tax=Modicella reniformis TaxID=1440133 RepID=A0A9P6IMM8_9FUNG|nr:hypothetical protein BGZ65_009859 [Modicella reniformis]
MAYRSEATESIGPIGPFVASEFLKDAKGVDNNEVVIKRRHLILLAHLRKVILKMPLLSWRSKIHHATIATISTARLQVTDVLRVYNIVAPTNGHCYLASNVPVIHEFQEFKSRAIARRSHSRSPVSLASIGKGTMRLKRHKDYKRYMKMYCKSFNFRKPYQVLVDADFIQAALDQRMDLRTMIPNVLCDASKQMATPCTMANLKSRGEEGSGAFIASKRFEKRRCKHQEAVDESICLSEIIADTNPHNYVVASQSKKLRLKFAMIPGVPLLYIKRANLILEPPSEASLQAGKKIENQKTHASTKELQTLKAVKISALGKVSIDPKLIKKIDAKKENRKQKVEIKKAKLLKKREGPKEPNPLSVKKKKSGTPPQPVKRKEAPPAMEESESAPEKKKRKRRKPKLTGESDGEVQ